MEAGERCARIGEAGVLDLVAKPVLEALEPRIFADRRAVGGIVDRRALCDVAALLDHRDAVRQCVDGAAIVMAHVDEAALVASAQRFFAPGSAARRVGKGGVSTGRSWW